MSAQPSDRSPTLARLIARQSGLARRDQLHSVGVTPGYLDAQLDGGRWRELNDRVICTHNGPLTPRQRLWAIGLSAQGIWAMCGLTVLEMCAVRGFATRVVHILVARGFHVLPVADVEIHVHESRRFGPEDVASINGLPSTRLPRATIDAAAWTPDPREACRILVAPVQQRLLTATSLRSELLAAGQVRHRRTLLALANDLGGGAQALSEVEFLRFCRRHGLPKPRCQVRLDSRGRRRYLDVEFRRADGELVRAEIDGGIHLQLFVRWQDTAKDNELGLRKSFVFRFPSVAIYLDDPVAVSQLRRGLGLDPL